MEIRKGEKMKNLILLALVGITAFVQTPKEDPKDKPDYEMTEAEYEKGQRIELQFQAVQESLNKVLAPMLKEQQDLKVRVCANAKIAVDKCLPNYQKKTVSVIQEPKVVKTTPTP